MKKKTPFTVTCYIGDKKIDRFTDEQVIAIADIISKVLNLPDHPEKIQKNKKQKNNLLWQILMPLP